MFIKKIIVSFVLLSAVVLYSVFYGKNSQTTQTSSLPSPMAQPTTQRSQVVSPTKIARYKDGTYTGNSVDAYYGNVQVQVNISSGQMVAIETLELPTKHQQSAEINANAVPILRQEAITVQSAEIDSVTRATFTSDAFKASLSSALLQAK